MAELPEPSSSEYEFIVPTTATEAAMLSLLGRFALRRKVEVGGYLRSNAAREKDKTVGDAVEREAMAKGFEAAMNEIVKVCNELCDPPPLAIA